MNGLTWKLTHKTYTHTHTNEGDREREKRSDRRRSRRRKYTVATTANRTQTTYERRRSSFPFQSLFSFPRRRRSQERKWYGTVTQTTTTTRLDETICKEIQILQHRKETRSNKRGLSAKMYLILNTKIKHPTWSGSFQGCSWTATLPWCMLCFTLKERPRLTKLLGSELESR